MTVAAEPGWPAASRATAVGEQIHDALGGQRQRIETRPGAIARFAANSANSAYGRAGARPVRDLLQPDRIDDRQEQARFLP
jgi:hypothetical protein